MWICFSIYLSISAISCQALATSPSPCHAHPFCLLLSLRHSLFRLIPSFTVNLIAPSIPPSFITSLPSFLPSLLSFSTDDLAFSPIYTSLFPSLFSFILSCVSPLFACRVLSTSHFVLFSRLRLQRGAGDERKSCERESRREKRKMEEGRRKDNKRKGRKERIHTSIHLFFFPVSLLLYSRVSLPSSHAVSFQQMIVLFPYLRLQGEELGTRRSGRGQW